MAKVIDPKTQELLDAVNAKAAATLAKSEEKAAAALVKAEAKMRKDTIADAICVVKEYLDHTADIEDKAQRKSFQDAFKGIIANIKAL